MVEIKMKESRYTYDVHALVKNFYPYEYITETKADAWVKEEKKVDLSKKTDLAEVIKIELEDEAIGISLFDNEIPILEKRIEVLPSENYKNQLKKVLYEVLSERTGRTLDWGTLTGVRPTKIPMKLIEDGFTKAEIQEYMKKEYLVSDQKIKMGYEIAKKELEILEEIHFQDGYSVYIGIPFCPTTCLYCSFASFSAEKHGKYMEPYLEALFREIDFAKDCITHKKLTTIYVGGGTPTSLSESQLERLMEKMVTSFDFKHVKEFTVEAGRPDSISSDKLKILKKYGVSRISINPQTMKDETLERIGRSHTTEQFRNAFFLARQTGHDNINMDLIAGLPGETIEDMRRTLEEVMEMKPDSITMHSLVTKRAARLNLETEGKVVENIDQMTELLESFAAEQGYIPYYMYRQKNAQGSDKGANQENVGYARQGKEGIYNILIMEEKQTILALGAGATSKFVFLEENRLERIENVKSLTDYISRIEEMIERKAEFLRKEALYERGF